MKSRTVAPFDLPPPLCLAAILLLAVLAAAGRSRLPAGPVNLAAEPSRSTALLPGARQPGAQLPGDRQPEAGQPTVERPGFEQPERGRAAGTPLARAADYLWDQQADDGGWHSETYALLRSGQALTPFVLHGLMSLPADVHPGRPEGIARGLDFIRRHTSQRGVLGVADPDLLEYPNYSTAYALRCLQLAGSPRDIELRARMQAYLRSEQFSEARGFEPGMPAYGGWGFGGSQPPGRTGHMDLAHTRRVLEALRETGLAASDVYSRAQQFLRVVQHLPANGQFANAAGRSCATQPAHGVAYDGGFYLSPIVLAANKGRETDRGTTDLEKYRSYATATCDGILSLLACGVSQDDPRVRGAAAWLAAHPRLDYPQGVPQDHPEPWGEAIHYYHLAVRAEVYRSLKWPGDWRGEIQRLVGGAQRVDGSVVNRRSALMKEDDPLLCTALALIALGEARVGQSAH